MKQKDIPTLVAIHVEDTAARYAVLFCMFSIVIFA